MCEYGLLSFVCVLFRAVSGSGALDVVVFDQREIFGKPLNMEEVLLLCFRDFSVFGVSSTLRELC